MKRAVTIATIVIVIAAILAGLEIVNRHSESVQVAASPAPLSTQVEIPQIITDRGQRYLSLPTENAAGLTHTQVGEVALPGVLETTGQVTFDDRLVSTIISRVSGRLEDIRVSQWDTVRAGENILSLYSPDFMTAEAEYLEAVSSAERIAAMGRGADNYGLSPEQSSMSADLKAAAVRKLELLGLSPADIANIKEATPSRWMRAPISGIVVTKLALRGAQVNPGDQLFALATLQRVWITGDIYEVDFARVQVGQRLEAVTVAYPNEVFRGIVDRISPAVDPNAHVLSLRCEVQNPGEKLKPQMLARVRIVTRTGAALVVPQEALVFDGDSYFAFVRIGPDRLERRKVGVAAWNDEGHARILWGLAPGDQLLTESLKLNALWHEAQGESY
jgi:membrane fusion protein, copper/silver efflux system